MAVSVTAGASATIHISHDYRVVSVIRGDERVRMWRVQLTLCDEMQDAPLRVEVWAYDSTPFVVGETVPVTFALPVQVVSE